MVLQDGACPQNVEVLSLNNNPRRSLNRTKVGRRQIQSFIFVMFQNKLSLNIHSSGFVLLSVSECIIHAGCNDEN